ncbi:DUF6524 family protein [Agarilytica rhodophyticola]|uniref:DUF6524 family protein n=1 Tax=Agarilytica rhodophyticola TaxID=1737490 RepID=UPI000B343A7F|nr:DUF6524 family protein [Agarilytica rhodophyticola]
MTNINTMGISIRFIFAILLVMATYNPTPYSYVSWVLSVFPNIGPVMALSGVGLAIGWAIYLRATMRSLGIIGVSLSSALFACIIWLLVDREIMDIANISLLTWIILVALSFILAMGMSWSHIRRRMSGQVDVDDVDQ